MRCLWLSWSITLWLSAILTSAGVLLPYWLNGAVEINNKDFELMSADLGIFRRCGYPIYSQLNTSEKVLFSKGCGHYPSLESIPHIAWRFSIVFISISCGILFFLTFFLFFTGFNQNILYSPRIYKTCQIFQIIASLLNIIACFIYPFGWHENSEVIQVCGPNADYFNPGNCRIGWAMMITIFGGFFGLISCSIPRIFIRTKDGSTDLGIDNKDQINKLFSPESYPENSYYFNPACDSSSLLIDSAMTSPMLMHSPKMNHHSFMAASPKLGPKMSYGQDGSCFISNPSNGPYSAVYSPLMNIRRNGGLDTPKSMHAFLTDEGALTPKLTRNMHDIRPSPYLSSPRQNHYYHNSMRGSRKFIETLDEVEYEHKTINRKEENLSQSSTNESHSNQKSESTSVER